MSDTKSSKQRPLAPHLQVYKPQLTSILSIAHRASGYALSIGTIMIVWMLIAAATGPDSWDVFQKFVVSSFGKLILIGWSAALFYHMCNGIRHLFWDAGYLLSISSAYKAGYIVVLSSIGLTILFWLLLCEVY